MIFISNFGRANAVRFNAL